MNPKFLLFAFMIFFSSAKAQNEFITIWKPSNPTIGNLNTTSTQIKFPGIGTNYTIYWEEVGYLSHNGTLSNITSTAGNPVLINFGTPQNPTASNATYRVKVSNGSGIFSQIKFYNNAFVGDTNKIINLVQWGNIMWTSMANAFYTCGNLDVTATDIPNLSGVSDFSQMFRGCDSLIGNISFNQWDMSSATNLSYMFLFAKFNQPIGNWNTSNVTNMEGMFNFGLKFNQPIGNWNTGNVTNMSYMFKGAAAFNQPIGNWNTSKVTNMYYMFGGATVFNQPIGNWNTGNVANMSYMFSDATVFNQPIGSWNTENVTNTDSMFDYASFFNQNLDTWNTGNMTNMSAMFYKASSFNKSMGSWNLTHLTSASSMLYLTALSCINYDKTLMEWANNPNTPSNINLGNAASLKYSANSVAARNTLVNSKGWTITGDVYDATCAPPLATSETTAKEDFILYPNPVKNVLYLKSEKKMYDIKIYTMDGRIVKDIKHADTSIDVSDLAKGNYIIKMMIEKEIRTEKFIKE